MIHTARGGLPCSSTAVEPGDHVSAWCAGTPPLSMLGRTDEADAIATNASGGGAMATDHDGALDCTPGAGDGERAPAAAPLHCDPTSTGSLESPHYCRLFSAPARYLDKARAQLLKCCPAFSNAPRSGKLCNKAAGDSSREGWQAEAGRRVRIRIAPRLPFPRHWVLRRCADRSGWRSLGT